MSEKEALLKVNIHVQPEYQSKEWYAFCEKHEFNPYNFECDERAFDKDNEGLDLFEFAVGYTSWGDKFIIADNDDDLVHV